MKKFLFLLLVLLPNMRAMENEKNNQMPWFVKKTIQHNKPVISATYNDLSKQWIIRDEKNVTLTSIYDEKQSIVLPHSGRWKPTLDESGQLILTSPNNETIIISNVKGKKIITINNTLHDAPKIVRFNQFADQLLTVGNEVTLRSLYGTIITSCNLESDYKTKIAQFFPHNDRLIFLAPHAYCYEHKAKLWDVRNKTLIPYDYIDSLENASFHPEGLYLTGIRSLDRHVAYVFDLRKKGYAHLANFHNPKSTKFNQTGTYILTTKYYNACFALLWDMQTLTKCIKTKETPEFHINFQPSNLTNARFHPGGEHIVACSSATIHNPKNGISFLDIETGKYTALPCREQIYSAKYDPTGNYVITRHKCNIVKLWQKNDGREKPE